MARETYRVVVDSCLLPNTTRFGTMALLDVVREEYRGDEVVWAEVLFSLNFWWIYRWLRGRKYWAA